MSGSRQDIRIAPPDADEGGSVPPAAGICRRARYGDASLVQLTTLVLWLGCLTIGAVGFAVSYARPRPPAKETPPIQARMLNVELTDEPMTEPEIVAPSPDSPEPPPLLEPMIRPEAPPLLAVAEPLPAIAFALPAEGPVRIVEAKQAAHTIQAAPIAKPPAPVPPVHAITYGEGEGKQPAPEYPRQAAREGQEGIVRMRFSVGEHGRVIAAEAVSPSPWPLLNEAALRAVRERWRFRSGPLRIFDVSIRFELTN